MCREVNLFFSILMEHSSHPTSTLAEQAQNGRHTDISGEGLLHKLYMLIYSRTYRSPSSLQNGRLLKALDCIGRYIQERVEDCRRSFSCSSAFTHQFKSLKLD